MALFGKSKQNAKHASDSHGHGKKITQMGLRAGTRITLLVTSSAGDSVTVYSSYETAINESEFLITAPMLKGGLYPLHNGDIVKVVYFIDSAHFESEAMVGERVKKDGLGYYQMICKSEITRTQRRGDFRISVLLEATVLECDPDNAATPKTDAEPIKIIINDLSAGGSAAFISVEIPRGSIVIATLPEEIFGAPKDMLSEVQWVRRSDNKDAPFKFYMGLRFIFEHSREKEVMVRYTIEQQRKQMGKDGGR